MRRAQDPGLVLPKLPHAKMKRWATAWGLPDLATRVTIEVGPRLTVSLARCAPDRALIRLHPALATAPASLVEAVLCHELAHIAAYELHGSGIKPHGRQWQALVHQAGFEPSVRLELEGARTTTATAQPQPAPRLNVRHRCPRCGMVRWSRRAVSRWRCRSCVEAGFEGELKIEHLRK